MKQGETKVQPLNDTAEGKTIARLNPLGNPGSDRIKVLFTVDEECFLKIKKGYPTDNILFNEYY